MRRGRLSLCRLEDRLAPSITVTTLADAGAGSLRQAVADAGIAPGADTIDFDPGLFNVPRTITLNSPIIIASELSVLGPTGAPVTVDANKSGRVFTINVPASQVAVSLQGLVMTGGQASVGGGIANDDELLTLIDCTITANTAATYGGGIHVAGTSALTMTRCTVAGNTAAPTGYQVGGGGGIFVGLSSTVIISACSIIDNATTGDIGGAGGGLSMQSGGSLTLRDSAVTGNSASGFVGYGGGVYFHGATSAIAITNSTISGNSASVSGGGLEITRPAGTLTIQNSTITGNTCPGSGAGGVSNYAYSGGTSVVRSSIIAGNISSGAADLFSNGTVGVAASAIGNPAGFTLSDLGGNLPFGADVMLAPLANNGGPTKSHALLPGSPAIDAGSNTAGLSFDQRGGGFPRVVGAEADIGAFEVQPSPPQVQAVTINDGATQRSRVVEVRVAFDGVVSLPAVAESAFQLKRQSDGGLPAIKAAVINGAHTEVTLTFSGVLTESNGSLADGRYTLRVLANSVSDPNGALDGDGNGAPGDDYVLTSSGMTGVYRFYGDADGDADVDVGDFAAFRGAFGGPPSMIFGDIVDAVAFGQFRARFGSSI